MSHIIVAGGNLYTRTAGSGTISSASKPAGVSTDTTRRPCFGKYRRETIIAGEFNPHVVFHDDATTFTKTGISALSGTLTVAQGAGSNVSARVRAYAVAVHKIGTRVVHRGNPTTASSAATISNGGVAYSAIPASSSDARVTHVEIYREDDGAIPRLDVTVSIGTTTATSDNSTATLSLATALPTTTSGATDTLARGVPPYCKYVEIYHDRAWYAGDPNYPHRVWYSRTGEPESVKSTNYIDTRDAEAVTGIKRCSDQLVVFTATSTYAIQGYSDGSDGTGEADLTMVKISPDCGCISHFGAVNVGGPNGGDLILFPAQDGIWSYNGTAFRYMMDDLRTYWRDAYLADETNYENSIAAHDTYWNTYNLLIPTSSTTARYYVGHLQALREGRQPDWVFDVKLRGDYTIAPLAGLSTKSFDLVIGARDGYLRTANQDATGSDDSVNKVSKVRYKHYFFNPPSGGINHGNTFTHLDVYKKNESQDITANLIAGDEYAGDATTYTASLTISAAATAGKTSKTYYNAPLTGKKITGSGLTVELTSTNPVGVEFKGFGASWNPGAKGQPASS